jgi:SAM-dependent methyltransferase
MARRSRAGHSPGPAWVRGGPAGWRLRPAPDTVRLVTAEPRDVVESGYDRIATRHLAWLSEIRGDPRLPFLHDLMARLPPHPAVLDLGCGPGVPGTALLAESGAVAGVDLSASQLKLASQRVPRARFIRADMAALALRPASFDAVTALYSIAHVPRGQHGSLFRSIATWLRPGGHLLAALGCGDDEGTVEDWLGAPMFFSSHDAQTNRRLLAGAGLTLLVDQVVTMQEPEGPATFQWVIAKLGR